MYLNVSRCGTNVKYGSKENYLLLVRSVMLHIFYNLPVRSIDFTIHLVSLTEEEKTGGHTHSTEYLRRQGCQAQEVI